MSPDSRVVAALAAVAEYAEAIEDRCLQPLALAEVGQDGEQAPGRRQQADLQQRQGLLHHPIRQVVAEQEEEPLLRRIQRDAGVRCDRQELLGQRQQRGGVETRTGSGEGH